MKKLILLILITSPFYADAQEDSVEWASPSVEGMNLGKGIVFSYRRLSPYDIVSESQMPGLVESDQAEIQRIRNLTFKLRLPVLLKERTQLVVGFEYAVDQFEFKDPETLDYPFYSHLHHKPLRSRALKFYLNHSFTNTKFLFTRSSLELNGDIPDDWLGAFKYTLSAGYGWKKSPRKAFGLGFYFSYSFGNPTLLPGILYNVTWNEQWGLESLFPAMVMLRYQPNRKNIFYFGYDVSGATYNVDLGSDLNEQFHNIQLRRSEVTPTINYEREVYDFIWMSLEAGYRYNINFNITEDNIFDAEKIIKNEVGSGTFIGASIFIIPTESLKKLVKKNN